MFQIMGLILCVVLYKAELNNSRERQVIIESHSQVVKYLTNTGISLGDITV